MSTDVLPGTQNSQARSDPQKSPGARRWKRGLLVIGVVAALASAVALIPGAMSSRESGPTLTHTIKRGDLVVSVTEQGTLESSNNTELKCKVRGWSLVTWVIEGGTEVQAGDELVRLDTKRIEDAISLQTTNFHTATATLEQSKAEVARAEIAIPAYLEGSYRTQLKSLERGLKIAETNLLTAKKMLNHTQTMFKRGYVT
ncbi:MAG: efflux RND transporter periplasmic adaptor subunit, partial [Planctomycetota bacterium]